MCHDIVGVYMRMQTFSTSNTKFEKFMMLSNGNVPLNNETFIIFQLIDYIFSVEILLLNYACTYE